jgi:hypothetical protein
MTNTDPDAPPHGVFASVILVEVLVLVLLWWLGRVFS